MQQRFLGKQKKGFTLIEILIALSIMAFLSGAGFISYQSSKREASFRAAKREVAKVIRLAQGYALQGKTQSGIGNRTPCGYGMHFYSDTQYGIFHTNTINNNKSCSDADNIQYPGDEAGQRPIAKDGSVNQVFTLPPNVKMIAPTLVETRIYFTIPFGDVFAYDSKAIRTGDTIITFQYGNDVTKTDSITINAKGDVNEN